MLCFSIVESTEYEMITGFLQGFVDNEINLNRENTCKNTCADYRLTRQYGCHNDTPCGLPLKNQRINKCKGILRDCEFIGSDLEICPSVRETMTSEFGFSFQFNTNISTYIVYRVLT